jgi:hypothetical protein
MPEGEKGEALEGLGASAGGAAPKAGPNDDDKEEKK